MSAAFDGAGLDEAPRDGTVFDEVAAVADAVLFEGYLLYPYRASAAKNQLRWQWGVLAPAGAESSGETTTNRTECLLEPRGSDAVVHLRVRFLQVQRRTVHDATGQQVAELDVDGTRHLTFDEGLPRHLDVTLPVARLVDGATVPIAVPGSQAVQALTRADGTAAGTVARDCLPLTGRIELRATELPGPYDVLRLRLDVHNDAEHLPDATRDEMLRTSLIGTHTMLAAAPGQFLSLTDPPEWARELAAGCENRHTWPVLAGPPQRSDLLLSSPIILDDHPQIAPESPTNLFDGLENDEILTLRTMVLTDEEKAQARATDPRSAEIIDAVEAMPPEILERLHGAIRTLRPAGASPQPGHVGAGDGSPDQAVPVFHTPRGADGPDIAPPEHVPWWDPGADAGVDPETDSVLVDGTPVARGSAVLLRPGRGGDAQDRFLTGMRATVQAVLHDVDGATHVAVSIDDDPGVDMALAHGRFRYFRPDELEVPG